MNTKGLTSTRFGFKRKVAAAAVVAGALAVPFGGFASAAQTKTGVPTQVEVYVTSQDLTFESIVVADLPQKGRFQQLVPQPDGSLHTEFGPGDKGYLGGRWWVDGNGDGIQNDGDAFFLCPLLGHGSAT